MNCVEAGADRVAADKLDPSFRYNDFGFPGAKLVNTDRLRFSPLHEPRLPPGSA
jgi:hypothetical protein